MTKTAISELDAMEIIDSRRKPTLRVMIRLKDGTRATASVPSGTSVGTHEALDLRDGDANRYAGMGVRKAAANVVEKLSPLLRGMDTKQQERIDAAMKDADGTWNKATLGANALLGVSMAEMTLLECLCRSNGFGRGRRLEDACREYLPGSCSHS